MPENTINNAMTMRSGTGAALGRIDQYEILQELGGGGFGTVYLALDTVSGIEVAVKGLPPFVKNNREEMENIRSNFALVSRLHHPNIAAALVLHPAHNATYSSEDVRQKLRVLSGDMVMVMEYAPGVTLSQWRKQFPDRRVPPGLALEITRQIAAALDYAHERKILHRDIKPANVMIETVGDDAVAARVLDFGLAAEIRSSMGRVSREIRDTSGTRPYMAPEQWLGDRQGPATDQYSLAVLFNELVTGDVPFSSVFDTGDPVVMMNAIGNRPFVPSQELLKPMRLALSKALAKKPEERFASCGEFVAALEGRKAAGRKSQPKIGGEAAKRRGSMTAWVATAAVFAVFAVGGYYGWVKYDDRVKAREEVRQEVYELKGKASQAREKNVKEEWHAWPNFDAKARELEGAYRAGEAAFEKDDYSAAIAQFARVRDSWQWLLSNKVERANAIAAKRRAEESRLRAGDAGGEEYAAEDLVIAANEFSAAGKSFDAGDFPAAKVGFEKADSLFSGVYSFATNAQAVAAQAKLMEQWKNADAELDREEKELSVRIAQYRKDMKSALAAGDDETAVAKGRELVDLSFDADDAKEWVDAYLRIADKNSNPLVRKRNTEEIRTILDNGWAWQVDVETMLHTDLSDPAVLNIFGIFLSNDNSGFRRNPALAREFFARAVAGGFKGAEKNYNDRDEEVRLKPYFDAASSGSMAKVRRVFTKDHPHAGVVESNGRTPMFSAAAAGNADILDYMESLGFKWNVHDENGATPFFSACANTNDVMALSAVKWFVEKKGVDPNWLNPSTNRWATLCALHKVRRLDVFDYLVSKGARVNLRDNRGEGIIHKYVQFGGGAGLVEAAIKAGADVLAEDGNGEQPIHYAAHSDCDNVDETIEVLLRHGAGVDARMNKGKDNTYWESYTPLHVACSAWCSDAGTGNRIKAIKALLANGANVNAVSLAGTNDGYTPFQMAAADCKPYAVELLLDAGAKATAKVADGFRKGMQPIHLAASNAGNTNCIRVMEILLANGVDMNSVVSGSEYDDGNTPLHCAIDNFHSLSEPTKVKSFLNTLEFLVAHGADLNALNKDGMTPFLLAASRANLAAVQYLRYRPNAQAARTSTVKTGWREGFNALHLVCANASDKASLKVAKYLIESGFAVNKLTGDGKSPFSIACADRPYDEKRQSVKLDFLKLLIDKGADVNEEGSREEYRINTPLAKACSDFDVDLVAFLLQNGAGKSLGSVSTSGRNLLHILADKSIDSNTKKSQLEAQEKIMGIIARAGIRVNDAIEGGTYKGYTALHFAASERNVYAIRALVESGADVNAQDSNKNTPLMLLAEQRNEDGLADCISYMLQHGADRNLPDKYGKTPLDRAQTPTAKRMLSSKLVSSGTAAGSSDVATIQSPKTKDEPKALTFAAQKLVGRWSCRCNVTYHDSLGSRADDTIKKYLPVSSTITLTCGGDGSVELADSSGRTFGNSSGKWKYRHGMLIMDLASNDGRRFRLSGIVNWQGESFELHYDNGEYANMLRLKCQSEITDLNAVLSTYVDGNMEVSISTKTPSFKNGAARCSPHVFSRM